MNTFKNFRIFIFNTFQNFTISLKWVINVKSCIISNNYTDLQFVIKCTQVDIWRCQNVLKSARWKILILWQNNGNHTIFMILFILKRMLIDWIVVETVYNCDNVKLYTFKFLCPNILPWEHNYVCNVQVYRKISKPL